MALSFDETLALIILARNVRLRYALDQYEDEALQLLLKAVQRAEKEVLALIDNYAGSLPDWAEDRSLALLDEFSDLTFGVRAVLSGGIAELVAEAGAAAWLEHNNILSFDGKVPAFNYVSLTAEQMQGLLVDLPVGGHLLDDWVTLFYANAAENIRESILTGMLQGNDYRQYTTRLTEEFGMVRKEATALARTYVQSVNTFAQDVLYQENADIIKGVQWTATLEPGYAKSGYGTCLRCATLDGQEFPLEGPRPPCPLHINCRCLYLPMLISWRELGVDMDDISDSFRPYTMRPDKAIGTGGRRTIIEHGFHDGDYSSWFSQQNETFQKQLLGPNRYGLLKDGKVSFSDFVDRTTGKLRTLKELGK